MISKSISLQEPCSDAFSKKMKKSRLFFRENWKMKSVLSSLTPFILVMSPSSTFWRAKNNRGGGKETRRRTVGVQEEVVLTPFGKNIPEIIFSLFYKTIIDHTLVSFSLVKVSPFPHSYFFIEENIARSFPFFADLIP